MPSGLPRALACLVLSAGFAVASSSPALAASSGGLEAGGAASPRASGGSAYGARSLTSRPVAKGFRVAPRRVTSGGALPTIRVRFERGSSVRVAARVVLLPVKGRGEVVRVDLGKVRTGRTLRAPWPKGATLTPGRYLARVHAADAAGHQLRRARGATGRARLTVLAAPAPPKAPAPAPAPVAPAGGPGTFPVAGPHTYGEGFGVDRGTHAHQGVDVLAAEGLANVAPTAGTIRFTDYQASGAGEYIVMHSVTGPDFFFAHCVRGSTRVKPDQPVTEGQPLCAVGSTGDSSATHLHFELWPNGWRTGAKGSVPVDPMALLRAWDR